MSRLRAFLAFLWDFIIGDDPVIAVFVVVALGITAAVAAAGVAAWWVMPVAVIVALALSVWRATDADTAAPPRREPEPVEPTVHQH